MFTMQSFKIFSDFSFIHSSNIKSIIKIRKWRKNIFTMWSTVKWYFPHFLFERIYLYLIWYIICAINFLSCKLQVIETIARVSYHEQPYINLSSDWDNIQGFHVGKSYNQKCVLCKNKQKINYWVNKLFPIVAVTVHRAYNDFFIMPTLGHLGNFSLLS